MKTLGVIGGIGPESTIEYYRLIISLYRERSPGANYPNILINSIDLKTGVELVESNRLDDLARFVNDGIKVLKNAGADFAIMAANTPHIVFDRIEARSPLPLLSIVAAARESAEAMKVETVGLFGTAFTMKSGLYRDAFIDSDIKVITPHDNEQQYIHEKYMTELLLGKIVDETKTGLLQIAKRMQDEDGIDALVLGGTELSLIIKQTDEIGVPLLDTGRAHVEKIVDYMLA